MINIQPAHPSEYSCLVDIWESSVRATHDFLTEAEIRRLKPMIQEHYMPSVSLYVAMDPQSIPLGFIGVLQHRVEMLFVDSTQRGKGIGKQLLQYALDKLQINELDVNEQNPQAVNFYKHFGFVVVGRSALDSEGNPYPILTMRYQQPITY